VAIGIVYRSSIKSTTTAATYTCAPTWTPAAGSLLVAFVSSSYTSPLVPTGVTGHGVTYTRLETGVATLSTTHVLSIWVGLAGGSPTSVACVASQSGSPTGCAVVEFEVTGAHVSGAAVAAIVNSSFTNTGTSTTPTVVLNAPGHADNRAMTFVLQLSNAAPTASGAWVIDSGASGNYNTPATGVAVLYDTASFNTAGAATTANVAWRMLGIEIKAAQPVVVGGLQGERPYAITRTGGGVAPPARPGLKGERGRPGPALRALMRHVDTARFEAPGQASPAAPDEPTGTVNATNANDTLAATGTSTVSGSLAKTNSNDTSAATGTPTVTGSLAKTNANDTSAATGSPRVSGSLATTNANDTAAATGSPVSSGSLAKTNANDTSAATGSPVSSGSLAKTNADDSIVAAGSSDVTGSLAKSNANDTLAAEGDAEQGEAVTGTVDAVNADDTLAAAGSSTVTGALAVTNADDTLAAEGDAEQGSVTGSLAYTNANDTLAAAGSSDVTGAVSATGGNDTLSAQGNVEITGSADATNADDTLVAYDEAVVVVPPVVDYAGPSGGVIRQARRKKRHEDEDEPDVAHELQAAIQEAPAPEIRAIEAIRAIRPKAKLKTTDKAVIEAAKRIEIAVEQAEDEEDEIVMRLIAEML
jgi:hypothetical protein